MPDFINTKIVQDGQAVDLLQTYSDLVTWLLRARFLNREEAKQAERKWGENLEGMRTLDQAREFRARLRELVEQIAAGKPTPPAAIEAINRMLCYHVGYPQLARLSGKF